MFWLLLATWLSLSVGFVHKETTINTTLQSQYGATVTANPSSVNVGSSFSIVVGQQEEDYDLKLSLDESWGFKPHIESTINITLDGATPTDIDDADFLITFAVGDWQYFSFEGHLDNYNIKSRIFPSLNLSKISSPVSQWMASDALHERWRRISNNGSWITVEDWKLQAVWPLVFVVTNDPTTNRSHFQFYHKNPPELATEWAFEESFIAEQRIDLYIMGESTNERYNVSSLTTQLSHAVTTATPTADTTAPSNSPSSAPSGWTLSPTTVPTPSPSTDPTPSPSTRSPTPIPSTPPSHSPTTLSPTPSPSIGWQQSIDTTSSDDVVKNYGVVITITLDYIFTNFTTAEILSVVVIEEIIKKLTSTNDECLESSDHMATERRTADSNTTILNATIIVCDKEGQGDVLVAINDQKLQEDIVHTIADVADNPILINKTSIHGDGTIILFPTSPPNVTPSPQVMSDGGNSFLSIRAEHSELWIVILFLQILACVCCSAVLCVLLVKLRSWRTESKRRKSDVDGTLQKRPKKMSDHFQLGMNGAMPLGVGGARMDKVESFSDMDLSHEVIGYNYAEVNHNIRALPLHKRVPVSPIRTNLKSPDSKPYKRRNYLPSPRMDVAVDQIPSHHLRSNSMIESENGDQAHLDQVHVQLLKSTDNGMEPMVRTASSSRSNSSFSMKSPCSPRDIEARTARGVSEDIYGHDRGNVTTRDGNTGGNDDLYGNGHEHRDQSKDDAIKFSVINCVDDDENEDDEEEDANGNENENDDASSDSEYERSSETSGSRTPEILRKHLNSPKHKRLSVGSPTGKVPLNKVTKDQWL